MCPWFDLEGFSQLSYEKPITPPPPPPPPHGRRPHHPHHHRYPR